MVGYPDERKLLIKSCATMEDLAHPAQFDSEGLRCLTVGKFGNTTDLTVGRYVGLVLFTRNEVGIESVELGIYNSGNKTAEVLSAKGDSGSLVWHMTNGKARIVGQLHSGHKLAGTSWGRSRRGSFYRTTWSAGEQHQRFVSLLLHAFVHVTDECRSQPPALSNDLEYWYSFSAYSPTLRPILSFHNYVTSHPQVSSLT